MLKRPAAPVSVVASPLRYGRACSHSRLLQGDTVRLPFSVVAFDLAPSLDVIQYLPRPLEAEFIGRVTVSLPSGHSIPALARKPL